MIITDTIFMKYLSVEVDNFVVGLSGGADSLCLTLLLNNYAKPRNYKLFACIVDHKLRPESSVEIIPIIEILNKYKIEYKIVTWNHDLIIGNVESKARTARYELLYKYCQEVHSNCLCTAHHALDQWETFFMRLSKGSGLKGLASIQMIAQIRNIYLLRPLLSFTPRDIKETLEYRFNITEYVHDPMNNNIKFERVRWRYAYDTLSKYNLDIRNVNQSIKRLQQVNDCLDSILKNNIQKLYDGQYLNLSQFRIQHIEMRMRILKYIIDKLRSNKTSTIHNNIIISYELLERMANIISQDGFSAINFCGVVFKRDKTKNIKVYLEQRVKNI